MKTLIRFFSNLALSTLLSLTNACARQEPVDVGEYPAIDEDVRSVVTKDQATDVARIALEGLNAGDFDAWTTQWDRSLTEAIVFDASGQVLARTGLSFTMEVEQIPVDALERAASGEVVEVTSDTDDRVRALVRLRDGAGRARRVRVPAVADHADGVQLCRGAGPRDGVLGRWRARHQEDIAADGERGRLDHR